MTEGLEVGDRVTYHWNPSHIGTIITKDDYGYTVKWDKAVVRNVHITGECFANVDLLEKGFKPEKVNFT